MQPKSQQHVWIINQFSISPLESGGTRHYSLAKELKKFGFITTIIASANNYYTGKPRALPEGQSAHMEEIDGVRFLWMRSITRDKKFFSRILAMLHFLFLVLSGRPRRYLPKPEIIMGSSPTLFNALAACLLAKRYKVPFVLEIRDLWPESLIEITGYGRYHPLVIVLRALEGWVYRNAQHIVTLLDKSALYFSAWGVPAERITVVSNGVDTQLLATDASALEDKKDFTILYMGAMGRPNSLETIIEAATLVKDNPRIQIHFVGDGVSRPTLEDMTRERGLKNVHFSPPVAKKDVSKTLADADATILHIPDLSIYRWGISPNKLYDYLLAARPVLIASGVNDNIVTQSRCGLSIASASPEAMAGAMVRLEQMTRAEREEMGQRGREYVLQHFNFGVLGERLAGVFSQCLVKPV